jgi:deoxyribodipyrimidine photolyase-related protein
MMEIIPEATYTKHHIQKIMAVFLAMRAFSDHLKKKGHQLFYLKIGDTENKQSFHENLQRIVERFGVTEASYQEPDEYRLDEILKKVFQELPVTSEMVSSEHFITGRSDLKKFFQGKKQFLMETFYRHMRRKHDILMDQAGQPVTGQWNYDAENRKKLPKGHKTPDPILFQHDVRDIYNEVVELKIPFFGELDPTGLIWPKNTTQAKQVLRYFIDYLLPNFGTYQDAMSNEAWSLYHSRLSFALNVKMISPLEIIREVERAWEKSDGEVSIAQAEGFIRQVVGWREYMRGIYWAEMPEFALRNFFNADRKLPDWFWTGETKMNCMHVAIKQSLRYAYAHHIQRLMVTGNFSALSGIHPDEVDAWYLGIYIDAFDWVEITNTRGMSQYADGGIVGTKPYVSSAAYINKMGDHCGSCHYEFKKKTGDKACPFNSLYWHFLHRNRDKLENNRRMSMMYRVLDKMDENALNETLAQAESYLENMGNL